MVTWQSNEAIKLSVDIEVNGLFNINMINIYIYTPFIDIYRSPMGFSPSPSFSWPTWRPRSPSESYPCYAPEPPGCRRPFAMESQLELITFLKWFPMISQLVDGSWWFNGHDELDPIYWRYLPFFKAYFSGLCKGISSQNMALYGTVPPF